MSEKKELCERTSMREKKRAMSITKQENKKGRIMPDKKETMSVREQEKRCLREKKRWMSVQL